MGRSSPTGWATGSRRAGYAIGIAIEVDALSLFFGLLAAIAVALAGFYSFKYITQDDANGPFFTLFLMLSGGVMGILLSGDLFNIYVMLEVMTFAAVGLTAFRTWNPNAREAAFKYLVVGSIGSTCILLGISLVYAQCHTLNLAQISAILPGKLNATTIFAFALLFTGFGCKSFMFPFQPIAADAHGAAPSSVSVLISGVFTKTGVYGIIRVSYFLFRTMGLTSMQTMVVFIGCLSMFVCVTMALNQHDFKRLLAFHSISQIGYILTALGLCTGIGIAGGLYHAINHTLFKGLLFLVAGSVLYGTGTTYLEKLGGLARKMPQTAALFLVGAFSISGIPPFNGFASKWMIYQATFEKAAETGSIGYALVTVVCVVTSVLTLASFVKVGQSVFFGQLPPEYENVKETPLSMRIPDVDHGRALPLLRPLPGPDDKVFHRPGDGRRDQCPGVHRLRHGRGLCAGRHGRQLLPGRARGELHRHLGPRGLADTVRGRPLRRDARLPHGQERPRRGDALGGPQTRHLLRRRAGGVLPRGRRGPLLGLQAQPARLSGLHGAGAQRRYQRLCHLGRLRAGRDYRLLLHIHVRGRGSNGIRHVSRLYPYFPRAAVFHRVRPLAGGHRPQGRGAYAEARGPARAAADV